MVQIKCLCNGLYSLKNSHIAFGMGFQPPPPPYSRILFEHHLCYVGASLYPEDDQHELNHQPPSADGDPTDSGTLQQMLLANWCSEGLYNYFRCSNCKKKQSLLQNTFLSNSNTTLHDFVLLMYQFCNSHRTNNTVAKETFLPQQLKK